MEQEPDSPSFGWIDRILMRPRLLLLLLGLLVGAALPWLGRLHFDASIERFTDPTSPEGQVLFETRSVFGNEDVLVLIQIGDDHVVEARRLRRLAALGERLESIPGVERVWSIAQSGWIHGDQDSVEVLDLKEEVPGPGPELERLRAEIDASPLYRGHLLSSDGHTAALVLFLENRPGDPLFQHRVVDEVRRVVRHVRGPERLVLSGNPAFSDEVGREMEKEQRLFTGVTLFLLILMLARIFRRPWPVVLPLVAAGGTVVLVLGAMAAFGRSVSVLSTIIPSMVLALGTAYSMHFLVHAERSGESAVSAFRAVARGTLLAAATTLAGFAALATSRIEAIREFGLVAALAVGLTGIFALLVPAAVYKWRQPAPAPPRGPDGVDHFVAFCERLVLARPGWVVAGCATLALFGAIGMSRVTVDTSFVSFLRPDHPANLDRLEIIARVAGPIPILITFDTGRAGGVLDPAVLRGMAGIEEFARTQPGVRATLSVADLIAEMNRAFLGNEGPRSSLPAALPSNAAAAAQLLLLYESSDFADDLTRLITPDRESAAIWVRTDIFTSAEAAEVSSALRQRLAETMGQYSPQVTGTVLALFRSSNEIADGQLRSLGSALLVIGGILFAMVRSLRLGLIAAAPSLLPILILFGAMGWADIPLNMGTALVACLSLGIGTDDTIHFLLAFRQAEMRGLRTAEAVREAFAGVGRAMVLTSVVLAVAFGALVVSDFGPVRDLGILTASSMILCLLGDALLLPAMLLVWPGASGAGAAPGRQSAGSAGPIPV